MVFSPIWHGKPPSLVQKSPVNMANSCTSEECRVFLGGGSKHVSKHEPFQAPNPHHSFRYSTQENHVKIGFRNKSLFHSVISVFNFVRMESNRFVGQFIQWQGCRLGPPGHLSSFSFFTSNNRKTASISSGRSKPLLSSSCRPESDDYRKIHCQS